MVLFGERSSKGRLAQISKMKRARVFGGELEVDYGGGTVKQYRIGDTFLEAMDRYHNGRVVGGGAVQILVVFMGAEGVSNNEMRK